MKTINHLSMTETVLSAEKAKFQGELPLFKYVTSFKGTTNDNSRSAEVHIIWLNCETKEEIIPLINKQLEISEAALKNAESEKDKKSREEIIEYFTKHRKDIDVPGCVRDLYPPLKEFLLHEKMISDGKNNIFLSGLSNIVEE